MKVLLLYLFVIFFYLSAIINYGKIDIEGKGRTGKHKAKLSFREPLHEPRVYAGAPAGVHVTTIRAYDPGRKSIMYNLLDVRDHSYFAMEQSSGNITTAKKIDKKVGDTYENAEVGTTNSQNMFEDAQAEGFYRGTSSLSSLLSIIAVAISQGETKLRQLQVSVTDFNGHAPVFEHDVYRGELHVRSKVGTAVLRIHAKDEDPIPYNAEVYYSLSIPEDPRGRFSIDPREGNLKLIRPLETGTSEPVVELGVTAVDGGSPKRYDYARIEIMIKTISEPRDVRSLNATGSTVDICWTRPEFGQVLGYIVKYREVETPHGAPAFLNVTAADGDPARCTALVSLKPWTDYEYRVYGWNRFETGQGSTVGRFGTRPDYCQMNICQHGNCHSLNEAPGYHCDCNKGYYGEVCQYFDPCSLEPCNNFGACTNISSRQYRCDCLPGFSGQNCSEFNPCALRPSPCLHGGRCESTASHKYQCHCTRGHYGKTCQYFDPCSTEPCKNAGKCQNNSETDFVCKCVPGYAGKQCEIDVDECASSPCKHGATCRDGINSFHCRCAPGYRGKRCHLVEHCPIQTIPTSKGIFRWNSTSHGRVHLIECPFGAVFHDRESSNTGFAKRRCYLLSNGSVAWGRPDTSSCREEGYKNAEEQTGQLWRLTADPKHLNLDRLQEATRQIEGVLEYAIHDKKIAHNMLSIVSNMLAINESVLRVGDTNGSAVNRVTTLIDRFVTEVKLERGESLTLETENLVVKAVDWDPDTAIAGEELTFPARYRKRDKVAGSRRNVPFWDDDDPDEESDSELTIPMEALLVAQNQTYQELRIKFVAYKNDKFFREKQITRWRQCEGGFGRRYNCLRVETTSYPGRRVLQASISNVSVSNLSDPVVYILPSPSNIRVFCAYWKEDERVWSTEGLVTNQTANATACYSTHMTSFSLLLDPTPNVRISADHLFNLSLITYIGCGLSMLGLTLTIITYSLFRCLNRDHPGQILLHLCISMLFMNASFLAGGSRKAHAEVCVAVAVLIHFFLLTSLAWMCVEATNMYQLLVHVFASSESHFMLKRAILAWGIPFIIVGVTVLMDWEVYYNQTEYCMLSSVNPYVYYISFLGPCCLILAINLIVFLMVTRVLFAPRAAATKKPQGKKEKILVTTAQVRGAFTVMVLLGVSWVFGAFAVGEARLIFQYLFCIANSLQGFLIFVVRCLQYPEARSAWYQLLKTGTFKKYRGMVPPGSWSGNSNSGHNKQNGHSTTSRLGSLDAGVPFSTNTFWGPEKGPIPNNDDVPALVPEQYTSDYASRGQLLTFSSSNTLKSNSSRDVDTLRRASKSKTLSRSNSETSQDHSKLSEEPPVRDITNSHYIFGLSPSVLIETTDAENGEDIAPRETSIQSSRETQLCTLPTEPKSRSSYASSIGYIDEEGEKMAANTLDRKIFASKASSVFSNVKPESPPDYEKQNSWPRTLSSFLGGKEPLKFSISNDSNNGTLPLTSKRYGNVQDYPSPQVIPLHVRPSSPSFLRDTESFLRTAEPSPDHHHHHHHVPVVSRTWRTTSLDVTEEDETAGDMTGDTETSLWDRQDSLTSPKEMMFVDSAASRL